MRRNALHLWLWFAGLCLVSAACGPKAAPPVDPQPKPTVYEQKIRWILQLEDERQLRNEAGDLVALLSDTEARVRRRAALAAGRTRLAAAVAPLTPLLHTDPDVDVRHMAAFAMGLIGDASAAEALLTALNDSDPITQGRAAEALGLIAHKPAASAVSAMVRKHVNAGAVDGMTPDDMGYPKTPSAEAVRV